MFIDDMTMPKSDEFGAQPPLEILRDLLVYSGLFSTKELHWKSVYNTTLLAACGGGQKDVLVGNKRLLQKFRYLSLLYLFLFLNHHSIVTAYFGSSTREF